MAGDVSVNLAPQTSKLENSTKTSFVYLVRSGQHLKIGRTKNVQARFLALQNATPAKLRLIRYFEVPAEEVIGIEYEAMVTLKSQGYHVRGEWFSAPTDLALRAIYQAIEAAKPNGKPIVTPA